MNGRELVKRAIKFQGPSRIPYNFDSCRTPNGQSYGDDLIWVSPGVLERDENGANEYGVIYVTLDNSFGEPKVFPLEGKETLEGYNFPDFSEDWRYEEMARAIKANNGEKYVLGMTIGGIFQTMIDLFGFNDFMMNVMALPELVEEACDRVCEMNIKTASKMAELGVDGVITIDDTALQDRPMMSMEVFNRIFKPRFKRFYDHCHSLGMDTFIHSCGYTLDIIEELIDAGLDVVNLDQQDNMGIWELSRRYKGRVCFYCPLDIQRTLNMDHEAIKQRVAEMVSAFSDSTGGFIAKVYPQPLAIGMTDEYLQMVTEEFKKY